MEKYLLSLLTETQWKNMKHKDKVSFIEKISMEVVKENLKRLWVVAVIPSRVISLVEGNQYKKSMGLCNGYMHDITINSDYFNERYAEIVNVILHEVAHAKDHEKRGNSDHSKEWLQTCLEIGMSYASAYKYKYSRFSY